MQTWTNYINLDSLIQSQNSSHGYLLSQSERLNLMVQNTLQLLMLFHLFLRSISYQALPDVKTRLLVSIQIRLREQFDLEVQEVYWQRYPFSSLFSAFCDPKICFSRTNTCPYDPIFPSSYQLLNPAFVPTSHLKFLNLTNFLKFLVFHQNKKWIHGYSINPLLIQFHNLLVNFHFHR